MLVFRRLDTITFQGVSYTQCSMDVYENPSLADSSDARNRFR